MAGVDPINTCSVPVDKKGRGPEQIVQSEDPLRNTGRDIPPHLGVHLGEVALLLRGQKSWQATLHSPCLLASGQRHLLRVANLDTPFFAVLYSKYKLLGVGATTLLVQTCTSPSEVRPFP